MRGARKSKARAFALDLKITRQALQHALEALSTVPEDTASWRVAEAVGPALAHAELAVRTLKGAG
jgi:hypothetical protein